MDIKEIKLDYVPETEFKYELKDGRCNKYEKAIYTKSRFAIDNGNFYLEALPKPLSSDSQKKLYLRGLEISPTPDLDMESQLLELNFLKRLRFPLPFTEAMERRFYNILTCSYRQRIQNLEYYPETIQIMDKEYKMDLSLQPAMGADDELGFPLVGESGCGKSTAVETMLSHYPQVLIHDLDIGFYPQILYIYVVAPKNGSLQDLFTSICAAVDRALGNQNRINEIACSKMKLGQQTSLVCELIRKYAIGVIVMDELQLLALSRNKASSYDAFLQITNTTKVGLMTVGTEASCQMIFDDSWKIRRYGKPLRASEYCRQPEFVKSIITILTNTNWFQYDFKPTPEIIDAIYAVSYGFINRILDLWIEIQQKYIESSDKPEITPDYIREIADNLFRQEGERLREAIESNPMFTVTENEPLIPIPRPRPVLPQTIQDILDKNTQDTTFARDRMFAYEQFKITFNPDLALTVFDRCWKNVAENGNKYSVVSIRKAVSHTMMTKAARDMTEDELVQQSLKYLNNRKSDVVKTKPVGEQIKQGQIKYNNIFDILPTN